MNRDHSDLKAPWNPREPAVISPSEFERQVLEWVKACPGMGNAQVTHQARVEGRGGEYAIDIQVRLTLLGGAILDLLLECKHQQRPVERDEIIILEGKLHDTASHKGILFSTSGFQKGALIYAAAHGVATVNVIRGDWLYETKGIHPTPRPPPWANLPPFAGERLSPSEDGVSVHAVLPDHLEALAQFLMT